MFYIYLNEDNVVYLLIQINTGKRAHYTYMLAFCIDLIKLIMILVFSV